MTPTQLASYLAVPGSGLPVRILPYEMAGGEPYQGRIVSEDGQSVGVLEKFKFRFVNFADSPLAQGPVPEAPLETAALPVSKVHDYRSPRFTFNGVWFEIEDRLIASDGHVTSSSAAFRMETRSADLILMKHPWSGQCEIRVDGKFFQKLDLFNPSTIIPCAVRIEASPNSMVEVFPAGLKNPASMGTQVILEKCVEHLDVTAPVIFRKIDERNRGGIFPHRFFELLMNVPSDGIILDIGGGQRQLSDTRYVNLEYSDFEEADLYGDATCLPFRDDSIDLVYSAAVMEHVRDPLKMGSEIARVLKPEGVALVNAAFMQPVHSEGQHFFNITPYGLEEVMRHLNKRRSWWDGNLSHMLRWFLSVSQLERKADPEDYAKFMEIAERMDGHLDDAGLMYIASAVWFEGVKS